MALGNRKDKQGSKQSSFAYELGTLKTLNKVLQAVLPLGQQTTLISVLNAIVASDQDIEILLVRDTGAADIVVQQISNYETGVPVVSYKDVGGAPYVPVGPLEYLDPSAVMNLVLTELLDQGVSLDSLVAWTTLGQMISNDSAPVVLSTEQEAILEAIKTATELLQEETRTHNTVSTSIAGTVPAGSLRGSVLNQGSQPATWNGITIPAGVSIPWGDTGNKDKYDTIVYDASGGAGGPTTFIIEYTT